MKTALKKFTFFFFSLMVAAVIGCGTSSSSDTTTGSTNPSLPGVGETGPVSVTGGTGLNQYGFAKLWRGNFDASHFTVNELIASVDAEPDNDGEFYNYFSDTDITYFFKDSDTGLWYALISPYTYDAATNTITIGTGDEAEYMKLYVNGTEGFIVEETDVSIVQAADAFSQQVTTLTPEQMEDENDLDDTIECPTINSLTATYSGGNVDIAYNITVPAGKTIDAIGVKLQSPALTAALLENEYNEGSVGQVHEGYESVDSGSGTVTGSGTLTINMPGAENGEWVVSRLSVYVAGDNDEYELQREHDGNIQSTYFIRDDETDKYKNTNFNTVTFTVSGSTEDL